MANFASMDFGSLLTVVTCTLEGASDWVGPLGYFQDVVVKVRKSPSHRLPAPHDATTETFFAVYFPQVTRQVLASQEAPAAQVSHLLDFLREAILLISLFPRSGELLVLLRRAALLYLQWPHDDSLFRAPNVFGRVLMRPKRPFDSDRGARRSHAAREYDLADIPAYRALLRPHKDLRARPRRLRAHPVRDRGPERMR
jgi:hypothetical protein